jgi:hypothetical protein
MSQLSTKRTARRGRLFPEYAIPQEELDKMKAEDEALYQRCRPIFERVKPELIEEHYNCFIIIEPESESYVMDANQEVAFEKAHQQYPNKICLAFRLNETGACGMI